MMGRRPLVFGVSGKLAYNLSKLMGIGDHGPEGSLDDVCPEANRTSRINKALR